jgi:hypothetical protein
MTPAYAGRQRRDAAIPQHSEPGASPTLPPGFERLSCRARARRFFNLSSQINEMPFLQRDFQTTIGDVRLDIGSTPIPCYGCEASLLLPQQFPVTYAAELAPFSLEKPGFTRVYSGLLGFLGYGRCLFPILCVFSLYLARRKPETGSSGTACTTNARSSQFANVRQCSRTSVDI